MELYTPKFVFPMLEGTGARVGGGAPHSDAPVLFRNIYSGHVSLSVSRDKYTALSLVGVFVT